MLTAVIHSLIIASTATFIGFFLMLPLAYLSATVRYRGKWLLETILLMPLVLPPTVVGFYILELFGKYGPLGIFSKLFIFTLQGAILAAMLVIFPILYQGLKGAIQTVSSELTDAAKIDGASSTQTLWRVILPNCWPVLIVTLLLAFCRALGEFGASLMVGGYIVGQTDTMANTIYFDIQAGNTSQALLLSLVNVVFGFLVLGVVYGLTHKQKVS